MLTQEQENILKNIADRKILELQIDAKTKEIDVISIASEGDKNRDLLLLAGKELGELAVLENSLKNIEETLLEEPKK